MIVLRRSPLKRPTPPPSMARITESTYSPRPRSPAVVPLVSRQVEPIAKDEPVRDEKYRRLIAALPCSHCGIAGFSQAAHGPTLGKGIKASDADVFPLCCDRPGVVGCHQKFDQYELGDAAERYVLAGLWAALARGKVAA